MDICLKNMRTDWHTNENRETTDHNGMRDEREENEIVHIESVNESNDVNQINKNFA